MLFGGTSVPISQSGLQTVCRRATAGEIRGGTTCTRTGVLLQEVLLKHTCVQVYEGHLTFCGFQGYFLATRCTCMFQNVLKLKNDWL